VLPAHRPELTSVRFLDAETIVSAGVDGALRVWRLPERKQSLIATGNNIVHLFQISPNGEDLFYATDTEHGIADVPSGKVRFRSRESQKGFKRTSWSPDGQQLHLVLDDRSEHLTLDRLGRLRKTIALDEPPIQVGYSQDGSLVALLGKDVLRVYSLESGTELQRIPFREPQNGIIAFSPDNRWLAYEGKIGEVILVDLTTGQETLRINLYHTVGCMSFSDDCRQIVSGHADGVARVWSISDGAILQELPGHEDGVYHASFSSDQRTMVTVSETCVVRLWILASGRMLGALYDPRWDEGEVRPLGFQRSPVAGRLFMGMQLPDSGEIRVLDWKYQDP
jgi:WD40 repeat protein